MIEFIGSLWKFIINHYDQIILLVGALITVAEVVARFTPTEKDDGAVERFGKKLREALDLMRVPNKKKGSEKEVAK